MIRLRRLGYNNSIHSVTKQKPIDIINGHLNSKDPFNIDINQTLLNNYIQEHRDSTKEIYKKLNEHLIDQKEQTINAHNKDKHDPLPYEPDTTVYRKNTTNARNKLNKRFSKEKAIADRKIKVKTKDRLLHKRNLRRPKTNKVLLLQDSTNPPDPVDHTNQVPGNNNNQSQ